MGEIVRKNPVNDPGSKPVKSHSTFKPNYSFYQTPIFGLNTPFFAMAGVAGDNISMRLNTDLDTFSLQAPSMMPIKSSVDYFMLPMRCLMPNAAELLITNPLRGDDVVPEDVNAVSLGYTTATGKSSFGQVAYRLNTVLQDYYNPNGTYFAPTTDADVLTWIASVLRVLQWGSRLWSSQSLLRQLGYNLGDSIYFTRLTASNYGEMLTFDDVFSEVMSWLKSHLGAATPGLDKLTVTWLKPTLNSNNQLRYTGVNRTYRMNLSHRRRANYFSFDDLVYDLFNSDLCLGTVSGPGIAEFYASGTTTFDNPFVPSGYIGFNGTVRTQANYPDLNLLRLVAYQKACAEFYTVDTVDDVYSAKLWEDNQLCFASYMNYSSGPHYMTYKVNGVVKQYDSCAGAYLALMWNIFGSLCNSATWRGAFTTLASTDSYVACWAYFCNLFSFTRSLRYQDYFVGSRVQPLAVGDVTAPVVSNSVDVIDVTKKIQVQRFLNQVNRIGRKFNEYVKGILGESPMADAHEPVFLAHVVDTIGAEETSNTGDAQVTVPQSKTSNYRSNSNRYSFTVHVPEPAIIIGIRNFDIPRVYGSVTDRENYHLDRYDAFNPYMQFVGDQSIHASELCLGIAGEFGYTPRYSEYKQRVSVASGSFLGRRLPGYAKIMDREYMSRYVDSSAIHINSEFIRSRINDIDEFYLNRDVLDPASAMHFIIRNDMDVTAHRPMAFNPQIL